MDKKLRDLIEKDLFKVGVQVLPKVSIIIPVYNVENYLKQCLDSVVNQTLHDIEIICVDDGSNDDSVLILDEYANRDERIKVIHKSNEGVSVARNIGLDVATGEYIMFLDSDDWYELSACEEAYNRICAERTDVCIFGVYRLLGNGKITERYTIRTIRDILYKGANVDNFCLQRCIWDKIYKKSFLDKYAVRYLVGFQISEDTIFNLFCVLNGATYSYLDKILYNYRTERDGSITFAKSINSKNVLSKDVESFYYLSKLDIFDEQNVSVKLQIVDLFLMKFITDFNKFVNHKKENKKYLKKFIKYLEQNFDKKDLLTLVQYKKVKQLVKNKFLQSLFSIKNSKDKKHKVIKLFGVKIKIKRICHE